MKSKKIFYRLILCVFALALSKTQAYAQVNPLISMYYQNQYLINPAMAGAEAGLDLNVAYKHELVSDNGTRATNALTLDYQLKKMGLGLNINMDKDGLINTNRYMASYAYHLPFIYDGQLHFGLSAGITTEKLDNSDLIGDSDDAIVMQYNDLKPSFDADFGLAYTSKTLSVQGVLPNIRDFFYKEDVDRIYNPSTFYAAVSYKVSGKAGLLEPKVAYRGLKYYDNILDAGVQVSTASENLNGLLMYHSTKNATVGFGFTYQKKYQVQFSYVSSMNSNVQQYTSGSLQIGLKLRFMD